MTLYPIYTKRQIKKEQGFLFIAYKSSLDLMMYHKYICFKHSVVKDIEHDRPIKSNGVDNR
jgi:hypothetical protein